MVGARQESGRRRPRGCRAARRSAFWAGVVAVWVPATVTAYTGAAWVGLEALAALWVALVRAIRGSGAMAWGLLAGTVSFVAVHALLWAVVARGGECAYEDGAGRVVAVDCGGPPPQP